MALRHALFSFICLPWMLFILSPPLLLANATCDGGSCIHDDERVSLLQGTWRRSASKDLKSRRLAVLEELSSIQAELFQANDSSARSRTDARKDAGYGSCVGRCNAGYQAQESCQCTASCDQHHNCCGDYMTQCVSPQSNGYGDEGNLKATVAPCFDKESCLRIVDAYLDKQPRNGNGLLQTYGDNSYSGGGGSCPDCKLPRQCPGYDVLHHCRFDTYDNALAAIYYTKRGHFDKAQRVLDGFIQLLYPDKEIRFNNKKVSYGAADGLPSKRWLTLLAAAYSPEGTKAGDYWGSKVTDAGVDVGNNAWAAIAFAHFAADANKPCYAIVARDILAAIKKANSNCQDFLKGFTARLEPFPKYYRSTEHNIDMYALARMLNDGDAQQRAAAFVHAMYGYSKDKRENQVYATGTDMMHLCDTGKTTNRIPVDTQTWNMLAEADDMSERKRASMGAVVKPSTEGGFIERNKDLIGNSNGVGDGDYYVGFRFSTRGNGAQWENSASGVMSLIHYRHKYGEMIGSRNISADIHEVGRSLRGMLHNYGSVLASSLGGNERAWQKHPGNAARNIAYPGGSDTGFEWTYLRYPHTAATAWTGFFLLQEADAQHPLNAHANPYAPPARPVPDAAAATATGLQCLGGNGAGPGPSVPGTANCKAYGCGPYNKAHACQCTPQCTEFGNCCADYLTHCGHPVTPPPTPAPPAPSMQGCKQRGCSGFDSSKVCQCNTLCQTYGNCCHDYVEICKPYAAPEPSCRTYGCSEDYKPWNSCQCTPTCYNHHNCCKDYSNFCPGKHSSAVTAACSAHPKCHGLNGNCCPTDAGMKLGCCY